MKKNILCVLLFFLFQFTGNFLYSNSTLADLKKETIYVLVPSNWSNEDIAIVFVEDFQKLDTTSRTVPTDIHRIGLGGTYLESLPFDPKSYPNLLQLLIYSIQPIPAGVEMLTQLRSLKIGDTCFCTLIEIGDMEYTGGPFPGYKNNLLFDDLRIDRVDLSAPDILLNLPNLEELYLIIPPVFIPERLGKNPQLPTFQIAHFPVPLFLLAKQIKITIAENSYYPSPEIAALLASGFKLKIDQYPIENYANDNTGHFDDSDNPLLADYFFWYPECKNYKQPKFKHLPRNGTYELYYPNEKKII